MKTIRRDVQYNIKNRQLTCKNKKDKEFAELINEINYYASLDDDAIDSEFTGCIKVENIFW